MMRLFKSTPWACNCGKPGIKLHLFVREIGIEQGMGNTIYNGKFYMIAVCSDCNLQGVISDFSIDLTLENKKKFDSVITSENFRAVEVQK